ncbi:thiamine phosphate synthase [Marinobacterium sp. D7]|uniref:thiamine phosphate synthase n=1 Tax=Marinobacterium ramblicola TaxID=2849041 RepID=UPI001C2D63DE|nr:thiamine phosphate synthase [Marinobacterium ramblicola]MBV1788903.1 thiamine phosphate synthase [Marinobacterium ramblicola]
MTTDTLNGLYAITDAGLMPDDQQLLGAVVAALRGGARIVQYRDKSADTAKRQRQAKALATLCRAHRVPLLINDDVELALASGADGVHLGQQDGSLAAARTRLGSKAIIGITCHDRLDLAIAAEQGGADYVAFGAFFPSSTKPDAIPAPLSLLNEARQRLRCPIVAIGGLSMDNASQVIQAGADMIAVIHALFAQQDIETQARAFSRLFSA